MNSRWLGLLGFLSFLAIPGIIIGEWAYAVWLLWALWFTYFFKKPEEKDGI
ncbi:MAG: hypothetical protein COU90_04215 [Candidatus Ryanbacteria bacterium CG10_big_fil_rev_8_21_14_0_10_43_42]|uniref:Uncharacterized protein n=1 Tax=Candidatus Ryanbacteria bacterium CG10_big_fil_rev_8_21_14_0_10_43_42 TaxID=1974864 RepID=A0A2M8KVX2_9BACT|nr:MAG: hypothetical protein COU90_04215 [Candidatus Ryanbacteria bacterium CG10_big_fil_rev_8_21_14_0_10_43_42]